MLVDKFNYHNDFHVFRASLTVIVFFHFLTLSNDIVFHWDSPCKPAFLTITAALPDAADFFWEHGFKVFQHRIQSSLFQAYSFQELSLLSIWFFFCSFRKRFLLQHTSEACGQPLRAEKTPQVSEKTQTFTFNSNFWLKLSCAISFTILIHWSRLYTDHLSELIQITTKTLGIKRMFIELPNQNVLFLVLSVLFITNPP